MTLTAKRLLILMHDLDRRTQIQVTPKSVFQSGNSFMEFYLSTQKIMPQHTSDALVELSGGQVLEKQGPVDGLRC